MDLSKTSPEVHYPDSDGKPMAETDLHRDWMVQILEWMRERYRGQRVFCTSNILLYYEQGNPRKVISPDNFLVFDSDPGRRRTYKLWEEGKMPDVIFEVTSSSTRKRDTHVKPGIYAMMGVPEYYLFDPTADYLRPPLQGYRLTEGAYRRLEPDAQGRLTSESLHATLSLERDQLVIRDTATGELWQTAGEVAEAGRRQAEAARQQAEVARQQAEVERDEARKQAAKATARAAQLEAEIRRLQEE